MATKLVLLVIVSQYLTCPLDRIHVLFEQSFDLEDKINVRSGVGSPAGSILFGVEPFKLGFPVS